MKDDDPLDERAWHYYQKAVRSQNVAIDEIDDCVQEVALASWQYGAVRACVVKRTIWDYQRQYGPVRRNGTVRESLSIETASTGTRSRGMFTDIDEGNRLDAEHIYARDDVSERDARLDALAAIDALNPRDQAVMLLTGAHGWTMLKTATALKVSESRVCQMHQRIVKTLRGKIAPTQT